MAKLRRGVLGPFTGKIGPVVAVIRNNTVYIRAMPRKSNKPRTVGQIATQEKFKLVHLVLRPLKPFINAGFKHLAIDKAPIDLAFSVNYYKAIIGTYPELQVEYNQLVVSEGRLLPLKEPILQLEPENIIRLTWAVEWKPYSASDDQVMLVLYCPALAIADGLVNSARRFKQDFKFKIQKRMVNHEVHVYVGVRSQNGKQVSNSQYLGRVLPI